MNNTDESLYISEKRLKLLHSCYEYKSFRKSIKNLTDEFMRNRCKEETKKICQTQQKNQ